MLIDPDYGHDPNTSIASRASMRRDLSDIIDRAIDALDALDADPDREDDEREEIHDAEEDRTDLEPWLGWSEAYSRTGATTSWGPLIDGEQDATPVVEVAR